MKAMYLKFSLEQACEGIMDFLTNKTEAVKAVMLTK